jgi:hypothetical protein
LGEFLSTLKKGKHSNRKGDDNMKKHILFHGMIVLALILLLVSPSVFAAEKTDAKAVKAPAEAKAVKAPEAKAPKAPEVKAKPIEVKVAASKEMHAKLLADAMGLTLEKVEKETVGQAMPGVVADPAKLAKHGVKDAKKGEKVELKKVADAEYSLKLAAGKPMMIKLVVEAKKPEVKKPEVKKPEVKKPEPKKPEVKKPEPK